MATLESRPSSAGRRRRWSTRPLNGATDHEVRHLDLRNLSIVQSPDLTTEQRTSFAEIAATNATLYRAYLLKEQLREVFRVKGIERRQLLAGWLSWALRSRIPEFVPSPAASAATPTGSTPPSTTACLTVDPKPPTPTCGH